MRSHSHDAVVAELEPASLVLSREERRRHAAQVQAAVARHPKVTFRGFDSDALGRGFAGSALTERDDLELRDLPLFSTPYVRSRDTMLGMRAGLRAL